MEKELKIEIGKWIKKAENDIKTVNYLFKSEEIITDTLCFHCQQCAEKYLKAYLVYKGIGPEKTHKIERLIQSCAEFDNTFFELKEASTLTEYAVEFRYADNFYIPSFDEAKKAFSLAQKVKKFIVERLHVN